MSSSPTLPRWPVHIVTVVWRGCARPVGSAPAEALICKAATSRSRSEKNSPWAGPRVSRSAPSRCGWGEVPRRTPASSPATVPHAVGIEPRRRTPWPRLRRWCQGPRRTNPKGPISEWCQDRAATNLRGSALCQQAASHKWSANRLPHGPPLGSSMPTYTRSTSPPMATRRLKAVNPGVMTTLGMTLDPLSRFAARCRPPSFSDPITRRPALPPRGIRLRRVSVSPGRSG